MSGNGQSSSFKQNHSKMDVDVDIDNQKRLEINTPRQETCVTANIGGRRSSDKAALQCGQSCPVMATSLKQAQQYTAHEQRYTTVIVMIGGLLLSQLVTMALVFFAANSFTKMPGQVATEISRDSGSRMAEHRLYVENLIREFESRQVTAAMAAEIAAMKDEIITAIGNQEPVADQKQPAIIDKGT